MIFPRAVKRSSWSRFELAGLTPGSEYLVKVGGRERKSGVATTDKVSRRFRMPHLGDSNRRVKVEVVIANDACETSPWKLEEKMTYRPAPAPEPPATQVEPTPTPTARALAGPESAARSISAGCPEHHGRRTGTEVGGSPGDPQVVGHPSGTRR